ncbi:MAG: rRNA adenine N-6-methyltransferase family protein, partial [Candidatus Levybacteria bacterium]|nr:rRNA adenine N-6-methyltransferase family protein [Candidatus Levybacteria bacterium]
VVLLIVLTFVWPPDSPWSPWWRTNTKIAKRACRLANISKNDIVYELGSGDGEFTLIAAKQFKAKRTIGIEIDHSRFLFSQFKKLLSHVDNAEFKRDDFKRVKLSDATVVYFYLVPNVIKRIMPKLKKELKPGTRIVSYKYRLPQKELRKKGELFLYEI